LQGGRKRSGDALLGTKVSPGRRGKGERLKGGAEGTGDPLLI